MISTQRLMLILITLNLLLTISTDIYYNKAINFKAFEREVEPIEAMNADLEKEETWIAKKTSYATDNALFNIGKLFIKVGWLFLRSLNPFTLITDDYPTFIEQMIAYLLTLIRGMIYVILAIETWNYFINKKST